MPNLPDELISPLFRQVLLVMLIVTAFVLIAACLEDFLGLLKDFKAFRAYKRQQLSLPQDFVLGMSLSQREELEEKSKCKEESDETTW